MTSLKTGILVFDGAEELDFVGPYEVFTMANAVARETGVPVPFDVRLLSVDGSDVTCAKGMRVGAHGAIGDTPTLDVLCVPGGRGTRREVGNPALLDWIARASASAELTMSVCTGSALLAAGLLGGGVQVTDDTDVLGHGPQDHHRLGAAVDQADGTSRLGAS